MVKRMLGVAVLGVMFVAGGVFGPSLVPSASAQAGNSSVVIADIGGGAAQVPNYQMAPVMAQ
jgi:hypothetical protein